MIYTILKTPGHTDYKMIAPRAALHIAAPIIHGGLATPGWVTGTLPKGYTNQENIMDTTPFEAIQQALSDMANGMIRIARAIAGAIWEALQPLVRWFHSKETTKLLARLKKNTPLPVRKRTISIKRARIYAKQTANTLA